MTTAIDIAAALICRDDFEGFSATPYRCPAGHWTIGHGSRFISPNRPVDEQTAPISRDVARCLVEQTLELLQDKLREQIRVSIRPAQEGALLSWQFNIGSAAMQRSTLIRLLNLGMPNAAAREFLRWDKATIKGCLTSLPGLKHRRQIEHDVFLGHAPADQPNLLSR